jgi:hypothetical protein
MIATFSLGMASDDFARDEEAAVAEIDDLER